ncbi:hypothetical protein AB3538_13830 [Acinetobacter baumannii]
MHNLGNNKALKKLAGIKGLWIANTRSINSEEYGASNGGNQACDTSDVAEGYGLLTKYIASLECLSLMLLFTLKQFKKP